LPQTWNESIINIKECSDNRGISVLCTAPVRSVIQRFSVKFKSIWDKTVGEHRCRARRNRQYFFAQQPPGGQDLIIHEASRSHTTKHHTH